MNEKNLKIDPKTFKNITRIFAEFNEHVKKIIPSITENIASAYKLMENIDINHLENFSKSIVIYKIFVDVLDMIEPNYFPFDGNHRFWLGEETLDKEFKEKIIESFNSKKPSKELLNIYNKYISGDTKETSDAKKECPELWINKEKIDNS